MGKIEFGAHTQNTFYVLSKDTAVELNNELCCLSYVFVCLFVYVCECVRVRVFRVQIQLAHLHAQIDRSYIKAGPLNLYAIIRSNAD